jgi:uncharacterized protein YqjF (DUF2071 family)
MSPAWLPNKRPWMMAMQWHDLAFFHWPVPAETLRPYIPRGLELQTFDGTAWLGVVPFYMRGVRLRCAPPIPGTGAFAELNLRTYVTAQDRPGVWFFSLDAASRLAVRAARRTFFLPYFDAHMQVVGAGNIIRYSSTRTEQSAAEFVGQYSPAGEVFHAAPGSIEHWFTERYCLYSGDSRGSVYRGDIQHVPWPLQPAAYQIERNTLATSLGVELAGPPPYAHFVRRLDVVAWYIQRIPIPPDTEANHAPNNQATKDHRSCRQ